jgi:TM2 domain-containing membrane protein YozV
MNKMFCYILALVLISVINFNTYGQYKINKTKYDSKTYVYQDSDKYIPVLSAASSAIIPGLGQAISGEPLRGLCFMGGMVGTWSLSVAGLIIAFEEPGSKYNDENGALLFLAGFVGSTAVWIWSIVDASKVAKVNNLAWRDNAGKTTYKLNIEPGIFITEKDLSQTNVGLKFKLKF